MIGSCLKILPLCLASLCAATALGQAGLRESLEKLDRNEDGLISPDEITPLSRPYLERVARARRMSLEKPNSIERLQEAARLYYSIQNGTYGRDVRPQGERSVKPFGPDRNDKVVPEFGLKAVKYPYIRADLDEADNTIRRYDRNRDGFIDRAEARRSRWTHRSPFEMDLNRDDRLSRLELAQRYARRRLLEEDSEQFEQRSDRTGGASTTASRNDGNRARREWWDQHGELRYVASSVLGRFDQNRNGRLEAGEAQAMGVSPEQIDKNRDGDLSRDELHAYLATLHGEDGEEPEGLPTWFHSLDANRDKQVAMAEFAAEWTEEKLLEFASLDLNGDGLLTSAEAIQSKALVGGGFRNETAELLPPRKTIISEIEVDEDFLIGDLNVRLSITHSHVSQLDGYLVGPDGQRIELFTEIGGSGDHFDQTLFDDQARYPINKAKAPYRGQFLPEGVAHRQPGLDHFKGKSVQGVWQLIIRGSRSDRFGLLHNWALIVTPPDAVSSSVASGLESESPGPYAPRGGESRRPEASKAVATGESGGSDRSSKLQQREAKFRQYLEAAKAKRESGQISKEDWARYKEIIERKRRDAEKKDRSGDERSEKKKDLNKRAFEKSEKAMRKFEKKNSKRDEAKSSRR